MATKTTRKRTTKKRGGGTKVDAYQLVTDRITDALKAGVVPWHRPWRAATDAPRSLSSRKPYRGVNVFLLLWTAAAQGYTSPWWGTYRQIEDRGGHVRKGEHGTVVVFWRMLEVKDDSAKDGKKTIPMLRYFTVFNADQCDDVKTPELEPDLDFNPVQSADAVVAGYVGGPAIKNGGDVAAYSPDRDRIRMPKPQTFESADAYYSVLFHEVTHSTGHATRLNREGITDPIKFGSEPYGREELIAEMGAAFLCAEAGIELSVERHAGYIQSWLTTIQGDPKLVVQAAGAAQKAATLVIGAPEVEDGKEEA